MNSSYDTEYVFKGMSMEKFHHEMFNLFDSRHVENYGIAGGDREIFNRMSLHFTFLAEQIGSFKFIPEQDRVKQIQKLSDLFDDVISKISQVDRMNTMNNLKSLEANYIPSYYYRELLGEYVGGDNK